MRFTVTPAKTLEFSRIQSLFNIHDMTKEQNGVCEWIRKYLICNLSVFIGRQQHFFLQHSCIQRLKTSFADFFRLGAANKQCISLNIYSCQYCNFPWKNKGAFAQLLDFFVSGHHNYRIEISVVRCIWRMLWLYTTGLWNRKGVAITVSPLSASSRHRRLQCFSTECLKSFILIYFFIGLFCFPSDDRATPLHTEILRGMTDMGRGMEYQACLHRAKASFWRRSLKLSLLETWSPDRVKKPHVSKHTRPGHSVRQIKAKRDKIDRYSMWSVDT